MPASGPGTFGTPSHVPGISIVSAGGYSSIWLAYVHAVDLSQHCINSLIAHHSRRVNQQAAVQSIRLDEHPPPLAYYLCAVTYPYAWKDNAHLAFEHAPGEYWHGPALVPGLTITLHDARPIFGWGEHSIPVGAPHAREFLYRTCRNWQFAWHLHRHRGARDMPNPANAAHRKIRPARPAGGQQGDLPYPS